MIGLDTNVLVRYVAQDDTIQSPDGFHPYGIFNRRGPGVRQPGLCR